MCVAHMSQDMQLTGSKQLQKIHFPTHTEIQPHKADSSKHKRDKKEEKKRMHTYMKNTDIKNIHTHKTPMIQCPIHRCVLKCHVHTLMNMNTHISPTHMKYTHTHEKHPHTKTKEHSLDLAHLQHCYHIKVFMETHLYVRHFLWGKRG